ATSGVVISGGSLCLVGTSTARMFRYNVAGTGANSIGQFDGSGVFQNMAGTSNVGTGFDVPRLIPSVIPTLIMSGETWHFQLWYHDSASSVGSSNFSNGVSVTFNFPQPYPGMVLIPHGSFEMGSNAASGPPYFGGSGNRPVHTVTISRDFWMGQHEVTQAEYQALMGWNPSHFQGLSLPVENLNWDQARAYCTALTAQEAALGNIPAGLEYRLPTEAEWEYACRAGTTTEYNVGISLLCTDAQIQFSHHGGGSCGATTTIPVGSFPPNSFGLYDMHGNVSEWCLDSYEAYSPNPVTDPFVTGAFSKIFRGGNWALESNASRSATRGTVGPSGRFNSLGFRVVLGNTLVPQ
ncbi:MAG: formylglycine-generating enzyme family protein, partial [Planctomycetota bacterium]|nr:formylglycine-generating enzyme family protein [Planctomycetota bacterium]